MLRGLVCFRAKRQPRPIARHTRPTEPTEQPVCTGPELRVAGKAGASPIGRSDFLLAKGAHLHALDGRAS